jgi:hypothetical protein
MFRDGGAADTRFRATSLDDLERLKAYVDHQLAPRRRRRLPSIFLLAKCRALGQNRFSKNETKTLGGLHPSRPPTDN